jgi:putative endonuclease
VPLKSNPEEWADPRHRRGVRGEQAAAGFLESRGWEVLAHRFRMARLEIDLIARRGRTVAFIEVKTRRGPGFGTPFEAVTWAKRREIVRVARGWMDRHGQPGDIYRFDAIGVMERADGVVTVQHLEDAFRPGWR